MRTFSNCFFVALGFLCLLSVSIADAAQIKKVKGKNVLIDLEGETSQVGDVYYTLDANGRRAGLVKIKKLKGSQAIAILGKGKAQPGFTLQYRAPKDSASASAETSSSSESSAPTGKMYWGVLGGFGMDGAKVDLKDVNGNYRKSVDLSGNSFSVKGLFDYWLIDNIWFRGMLGLEGFSVTGPSDCGASPTFGATCDAQINYLAADFWGRYSLPLGNFRPWVGAGVSILFPATKKATALDESSITTSNAISAGFGIDWFTSSTMFIPLAFEYSMMPESNEVKPSKMSLRAGIGFAF